MSTVPRAHGILNNDVTQISILYNYVNTRKTSLKYTLNILFEFTYEVLNSTFNTMHSTGITTLKF